jgi:pimeloyl-ACP methyl ester carboxylesterase
MNRYRLLILIALLTGSGCSYLPESGQDFPELLVSENRDYIEILPGNLNYSNTGFMFYPGGLVDPHGYLELASMFATSGIGHHVIIAKMPANLAVLDAKAAVKILKEFPDENWVLGGHSLGGAMACSLLAKESERFEGLVLMASYPSTSSDLSKWEGAVLSLTASMDMVLDQANFKQGKALLPPQARYYDIAGGNHSGFGSYGDQKGDGEAEISREAQHLMIIEQLQNFYLDHGFE